MNAFNLINQDVKQAKDDLVDLEENQLPHEIKEIGPYSLNWLLEEGESEQDFI